MYRWRETYIDRYIDWIKRETKKYADKLIDRQTDRQIYSATDKKRQINRQKES